MALTLAAAGAVLAVLAVLAGCDHNPAPPAATASRSPAAPTTAQTPPPTPSPSRSPTPTPTATAASGVPAPPAPQPAAVVKPLPTDTKIPPSGPAAAGSWRLAFSGGCFYLKPPSGGGQTPVVWPRGYTARIGPLGVYNAHGQLVGRPGNTMSLQAERLPLANAASGTVAHPACLGDAKTALFVT